MKVYVPASWFNSPLGRWAQESAEKASRPAPYAARVLARKHHLPAARAALMAMLAGMYVGEGI